MSYTHTYHTREHSTLFLEASTQVAEVHEPPKQGFFGRLWSLFEKKPSESEPILAEQQPHTSILDRIRSVFAQGINSILAQITAFFSSSNSSSETTEEVEDNDPGHEQYNRRNEDEDTIYKYSTYLSQYSNRPQNT